MNTVRSAENYWIGVNAMRLIDADELKEILIGKRLVLKCIGGNKYALMAFDYCIRRIDDAPIIEAAPVVHGWTPCSERLPDTGTEVLVTLGYTYESDYTMYSIARYIRFDDGECHWCDNRYGYLEWDKYSDGRGGNSSYKVIAWMQLPKLYCAKMDGKAV